MRATEDQLVQISRRAVNATTRKIMTDGITLTWDQVDSLGDEPLDWMRERLGLKVKTTDAGAVFSPARTHAARRSGHGYYGISDGDGTQLASGLPPETARKTAQRRANDLGRSVWLWEAGAEEDGEEFTPEVGHRVSSHATRRSGFGQGPKAQIENWAVSGMPLSGEDVAVVSRDKRTIKLRHAWPDDTDARIWSGVRQAFMALAGQVANKTGRPVEVYTKDGVMLEQVSPAPKHHVSQDAASRLKAIRKSLSTVELDLTWERDTDTDGGLVAEVTGQSMYDVNELVSYLKTMGHEVSKSQDGKQSWIWVA